MEKLYIGIPSFNEAKYIHNVLKCIDNGLSVYRDKYECLIVNVDNGSNDGTTDIFNGTHTKTNKKNVITDKIGKGENVLTFINMCINDNVDYAAIFDSDLESISEEWITKMLNPIIQGIADYVTPLYKRGKYEANITNNFAMPAIYATYGRFIRQPISGEFAFSKKYLSILQDIEVNKDIRGYGIDIFMTSVACAHQLKIMQVTLSEKKHKSNAHNLPIMAKEVIGAFCYSVKQLPYSNAYSRDSLNSILNSISSQEDFPYFAFDHISESIKMSNLKNMQWTEILAQFLIDIITDKKYNIDSLIDMMLFHIINLWNKFKSFDEHETEYYFIKQTNEIKTLFYNGYYNKH